MYISILKVILDQLKVLKEYQKLCENALLSIKQVINIYFHFLMP